MTRGHAKVLFSSDAGWSTLDKKFSFNVLTSMSRAIFDWGNPFWGEKSWWRGRGDEHCHHELESERKKLLFQVGLTLKFFQMYRVLSNIQQHTLEIYITGCHSAHRHGLQHFQVHICMYKLKMHTTNSCSSSDSESNQSTSISIIKMCSFTRIHESTWCFDYNSFNKWDVHF